MGTAFFSIQDNFSRSFLSIAKFLMPIILIRGKKEHLHAIKLFLKIKNLGDYKKSY